MQSGKKKHLALRCLHSVSKLLLYFIVLHALTSAFRTFPVKGGPRRLGGGNGGGVGAPDPKAHHRHLQVLWAAGDRGHSNARVDDRVPHPHKGGSLGRDHGGVRRRRRSHALRRVGGW